jgi:hypothetical protein
MDAPPVKVSLLFVVRREEKVRDENDFTLFNETVFKFDGDFGEGGEQVFGGGGFDSHGVVVGSRHVTILR